MTNRSRLQKIVFSALFCALVFAATWIAVPVGIGNVNLGDGILLLGAWILGGPWAAIATALGATLADLTAGYTLYAPGTFVIKLLMAAVAILICKFASKLHLSPRAARIIASVCAELVMILGYFGYEAIFLGADVNGIAGAALNIPFNAVQGLFAIIVSNLLYEVLAKSKIVSSSQ